MCPKELLVLLKESQFLGGNDEALHFVFVFEARQKTCFAIRKTLGGKAQLVREGLGLGREAVKQPPVRYREGRASYHRILRRA